MTKLPALVCALGFAVAGCETMDQASPQTPAVESVEPREVVAPDPRVETIEPVELAKPPVETTHAMPAVAPVEPRFAPPPRKRVIQRAPNQDPPCPACGMG
jgi:hypothetical protein